MKTKIITILATVMLLGLPVANGEIVVIDFESLVPEGDDRPTNLGSSSYSEDGFTLTTSSPLDFWFIRMASTDSIVLFSAHPGDTISLGKDDGGIFDLLSIDFSPYVPYPTSIQFIGTLYDGTTIDQSFSIFEGNECTVIFTDFTDLISVSWQAEGGYDHFDNITIIPEPTTLLLFGLGGLVLIRGRKAA